MHAGLGSYNVEQLTYVVLLLGKSKPSGLARAHD